VQCVAQYWSTIGGNNGQPFFNHTLPSEKSARAIFSSRKSTYNRGFPLILEQRPNSRRQEGDTKQVPYWGRAILYWPVDVTVIWRFLLGACELIHIFVCKEKKTAIITLQILGAIVKKIGCLGNLAPGICAPLTHNYK
jgi:hypothetical protein